VVSTPLKNISQLGLLLLFPIYGKMKNVSNHQPGKFTSEFDSLRNIFKNKKNQPVQPRFYQVKPPFLPVEPPKKPLNQARTQF
jgi:hypothetical protein